MQEACMVDALPSCHIHVHVSRACLCAAVCLVRYDRHLTQANVAAHWHSLK